MNDLRILPPSGLWSRLRFYSDRYGIVHALCRYVFSHWIVKGWHGIGPLVTKSYLRKWLASPGKKVLNLGGGGNCLVNCLTVDIDPRADCYVDLRRVLPFESNTIDAIFCEEAIEHISKGEGEKLLNECLRILRPDGVMRITTPDLDYLAAKMNQDDQGCDQINQMFYEHGHRYLYSKWQLKRTCEQVGFVDFKWSGCGDANSSLGYLDSHADRFKHLRELAQYAEMRKTRNTTMLDIGSRKP